MIEIEEGGIREADLHDGGGLRELQRLLVGSVDGLVAAAP
jgi:hypothetical protein